VLAQETDAHAPQSPAERVFDVLSAGKSVSFDPMSGRVGNARRAQLNATTGGMRAVAAHRTRKALAVVLDKLVARGVLTRGDVDDILLAAVDFCEATPIGG
jgi:hypothetical protein